MEKFAKLMLSFASQKMRDRSKFHARGSSFKDLHKSVGKDVLPQEYGGNAGSIQGQVGEDIYHCSRPLLLVSYLVLQT